MAQHETPLLAAIPTTGNLAAIPPRNATRHPDRVAFEKRVDGEWRPITSAEFAASVRAVAKGLVAAGIRPGDRVALMSRTRYEWTVFDFAIWTAGAVVVPIYETSSADQVEWIVRDSGARAVVVEDAHHLATVERVREREGVAVEAVWVIDHGAVASLTEAGRDIADADLDAVSALAGPDDVATIIYTSGTTGRPKGCELTHSNFMALSVNTLAALEAVVVDGSATILFLPLAHVFARLIQVLVVDRGVRLGHSPDVKNLLDDLATFQPTFLLAVPRVLEKIYNGAEAKAVAGGTGKVFHAAARVAIAHSRATEQGSAGLRLRLEHALYDRLVYGRLREAMGGKVEYVVSGGAPLGTRLGHFFRGIGCTVLEGYGLTETTAPVAVNLPDRIKIGTVGPPLPGIAVRTADDGELLFKGINIFRGYHENPQATAEALEDGWFHTGDIGTVDEDGFITITGRKKELIVTAGGKNVAPAVLEDRLRAHALVSQCVVVGDHRPFIGALISLDEEMWPTWAKNHGLEGVSFEQARSHERVLAELQTAVDFANEAVSRAESVRKFAVLDTDFTEANGYLTPSLKVRRFAVLKDFAGQIDELYGGPVEAQD